MSNNRYFLLLLKHFLIYLFVFFHLLFSKYQFSCLSAVKFIKILFILKPFNQPVNATVYSILSFGCCQNRRSRTLALFFFLSFFPFHAWTGTSQVKAIQFFHLRLKENDILRGIWHHVVKKKKFHLPTTLRTKKFHRKIEEKPS